MNPNDSEGVVLSTVATALGIDAPGAEVRVLGARDVLPSSFDVTGLAAGSIAAASQAIARLAATRAGASPPAVAVDRRAAAAAFVPESLFTPVGWAVPPLWDPLAGNYATSDGWIRLHTNYRHHRRAAVQVLGGADSRESVTAAVAGVSADDLEAAVVAAGGCAAALRTPQEWRAHPAGAAAAAEPLIRYERRPAGATLEPTAHGAAPLAGIRVLDITRVIAGPVATRFLAAYGAEVLRIDPPGFDEVPALIPEMTAGKRCTTLDLTEPRDRETFEDLLRGAHVLVSGLRPAALQRLGYGPAEVRALNPEIITAALDAYGWSGPWAERRGFDSLVQMSTGIAAPTADPGRAAPVPLPAQALDHATGYLCATAVVTAVDGRIRRRQTADIRCSLVATAELLRSLGSSPAAGNSPAWNDADTEVVGTAWGPARHAPLPRTVAGLPPQWSVAAGPLGRDAPSWVS